MKKPNVLFSPRSLVAMLLTGVAMLDLGACGTADQPNYAEVYQAKNQRLLLDQREFSLTVASPTDTALDIEMLSITEEGDLLLRTQFGIEKYRKDDRKLFNGQYIYLVDVDTVKQEAHLKTWAKPIF